MTPRQAEEIDLLRTRFPDLEIVEEGAWVRLPCYGVPGTEWTRRDTPVVFQVPATVAQEPYGFYVPNDLALKDGTTIQNFTDGETPFSGRWGKFSWNITWQPAADIRGGTTMLDFAMSFARRLAEGA